MAIAVRPLHPTLGAEVLGVDLRNPLPAADFAEIEAIFNRYAVLVFPRQLLTDEQQMAFSRRFGPLETNPSYAGNKLRLRPEIADISNIDYEGNIQPLDAPKRLFSLGNHLWHTDSSFKHVPARCSLLSAREVPPSGGETEFADLRAAYDALPEERKRQLDGLVLEHSIYRSRSLIGFAEFDKEIYKKLPPVRQMLVRRHPGSGRMSLYLAAHASHVIGWPVEEGRRLIEELIAFATQPQFVYSHRWTVGDLVMWDDRCTMHRGRPYDEAKYRRDMHRTTVSDEINTVERAEAARGSAA
ncbi:MAG TPA: TauD/TfdA family dioxygenase [Stellaceae bacterium]|nr:TauD/TfdA family dioxygenase [Stellaceae bacterium]